VSAAEKKPDLAVPEGVRDGAALSGAAQHCSGTTKMLMDVSTFSTFLDVSGCVSSSAEAFLILYRYRDLDGFRALAKSPAAGAQLYALCGLKHLRVDGEMKELRRKLSASPKTAALYAGCDGPGPMTPVSQLIAAKTGQQQSDFDLMCDYMIEEGMQPYRRPCDTKRTRLKCQ
jgi:hypothetical protein